MDFTDNDLYDLAEDGTVKHDQHVLASTVGTIVPDDISDLLPIILGSSGSEIMAEKNLSDYVKRRGSSSDDEDESCESDENGVILRNADANETTPRDEDINGAEQNCYVALQDDPEQDEFGGFVEYDMTGPTLEPIAFAADRSSTAASAVAENIGEAVVMGPSNAVVNIAPLTSGSMHAIRITEVDAAMSDHRYELRYLEQLSTAHKASILLYFRESKSVEIARKIRPEVNKIIKTGELKDVMRMIEKYNCHPNVQGINLLIAEVDHTTQKLVEFLRRRHVEDPTRSHPLLPVVLLIPEDCEPESAAAVRQAPGIDVILQHPYEAREVFGALIGVLSRIESVQTIYSDIHKFKESRKYMHLPIFDDFKETADKKDSAVAARLPRVLEEASDLEDEEDNDSVAASEVDYESGDEDVVPDFLVALRSDHRFSKSRSYGKIPDPKERSQLDIQIAKRLRGGTQAVAMHHRDSLSSRGSLAARPSQVDRSGSALVDMSHKKLLEDTTRPQWRLNHPGRSDGRKRPSTAGQATAFNPALMPFINRPTPVLRARSVAGLNKREAANCWKTLQNKTAINNFGGGVSTEGPSNTSESIHGKSVGASSSSWRRAGEKNAKINRDGGESPMKNGQHETDLNEPILNRCGGLSAAASPMLTQKIPSSLAVHDSFDGAAVTDSPSKAATSGPLTAPAHETPHRRRSLSKVPSASNLFGSNLDADGSSLDENSIEPMGYIAQQAKMKKQLMTLISKAPNDPDTKNIIPVNLSDRVLGFDIRDQLELGHRYEQDGDFANAEVCYTRAVVASKKLNRNVPLMMRGVVFFMQKKYFLAIRDFSEAIPFSAEEAGDSTQEKADIAAALHNRALAYFCVGNDTNGVDDLCCALDHYQPENLKIREMLLLAYRRLGKFNQATSECIKLQHYISLEKNSVPFGKARAKGTHVNSQTSISSAQDAIAMFNQDRRQFGSALAPRVPVADRDSIKARTSMAAKAGSHGGANLALITSSRRMTRKNQSASQSDRSGVLTAFDSINGSQSVLIRTIGIPVAIPDFSIKKKKNRTLMNAEYGNNDDGSLHESQSSMNLDQAKADLGFSRDIFESIFIRTSPLQDVLSIQPNMRSMSQLTVVAQKLKEVPFLYKLADADLRDLAACVEYRVITTKGPLFSQDRPLDVFCILLTGQWQMRLDILDNVVQLGNLEPMDIYGHLDLLFQEKFQSRLVSKYMGMAVDNRRQAIEDGKILSEDEESIGQEGYVPRGLTPNTFMSCYVMKPTEVLLISAEDFSQRLFSLAEKDFEKRMELLSASGLFNDELSVIDIVRMVRMCRVEAFRPGTIILKQGEIPTKLFFVMNGICKVQKRPDKAERTRARLLEMTEQTDEHDMKYSFHHKLRGHLTPAPPEFNKIAAHNFATAAEAHRHKLGLEIEKLEQSHILREKSNSESDIVDVTTLKWPRVFGEASVAVPEGRSSLGTIVADTFCEVLWVHKAHLQTFKLGEAFQERLRLRAVRYASDHILVEKLQNSREWSDYRSEVLVDVSKTKWPGYIKPSSQPMRF